MTNDPDKLDDLIAQAARSYNTPTTVPREEMWNRIAEARRTQAAAPRSTRHTAPWIWSVVGLAAAGLVAVGVTIGRYVERAGRATKAPSTQTANGPDTIRGDGGSLAYRLAVVDHVAGSEAMITAFRGAARRGDVDPQMAKWSRDLLGETRLLEGSAPPNDVEMKRLLEDLELVLGQIVQYTNHGTHSADDLDLIERSIKDRAVMNNMRTMSAGRLPSGT